MQMIEKLKKEDKLSRALSLLNIENLVRKIKNRRVVKGSALQELVISLFQAQGVSMFATDLMKIINTK